MKRKLLTILIIFSTILLSININNVKAEAISAYDMVRKFQELKNKYPEGSTWNGAYTVNGVEMSWECMGWAETVCDYLFGENPRNWVRQTNWNNLCVGDHVRINSNNHSIVITNMIGDTIYYADCNAGYDNKVHWNKTMSRSELISKGTWFKSQPDNWIRTLEGANEAPVDLGNEFYAVILNKECWKPITCDDDNYIRLRTETGTADQVWLFKRQSDGSYTIASAENKKLLEMTAGDTTDGKQVTVGGEDWGGNYQRWFIYEYGGGYIIKSHHYVGLNRVLDLQNNNSTDGTHIVTFTRNNSAAQIWAIYKGDEVQLKAPTLSVKPINSSVTFTWNEVYGEKRYDVKIWKGLNMEGEAYHIKWGASAPYTLNLPVGHYVAYVDATNEFLVKRSNVVEFEIKQPIINSSIDSSGSVYKINTSVTDLQQSAVCVVGVYTADGTLSETDSIELSSEKNSAFFAFAKDSNVAYIKIFLWDNLKNMTPLAESKEIFL